MNIILAGIEYSGTTTLGVAISEWFKQVTGIEYGFHDHFKIPDISHSEYTDQEKQLILNMSPRLKEMMQRHQLMYHVQPTFYSDGDLGTIGHHIEDAVYGPLYWGYGGDGQPGDINETSRRIEEATIRFAPETILVLVEASSDVIIKRMDENPRNHSPLLSKDVGFVSKRFREEFEKSLLPNKFVLNTSSSTAQETLDEFVELIQPFLEEVDLLRMKLHKTK